MTRVALFTVAFGFLAGTAVLAAFADFDADGDGALTVEEFAAGYPDLAPEVFGAVDVNADGRVTEAEVAAAVADGLLPAD